MKLPRLDDPAKYAGLYVFDFGDQVAVGYTADEIAVLLESEKHHHGKVYKIYRAYPDGTMELKGVPNSRFQLEEGLFFYRLSAEGARRDFEQLKALAADRVPPCRAKVHLAQIEATELAHCVALIYPADYSDEISQWLSEIGFDGGDRVEGGIGQVTDYYQSVVLRIDQHQLWGTLDRTSRPAEEVLANVHMAVQR